MKKLLYLLGTVCLLYCFFSCAGKPVQIQSLPEEGQEPVPPEIREPDVSTVSLFSVEFPEIWAYLVDGTESYLSYDMPLTDVGYFGAEIDTYGSLINVPDPADIAGFTGRIHLVVCCNSTSLTHFCLEPEGNVRDGLIDELLAAAGPYDGLQIDFELVPKRDRDTFLSFLKELKAGLGDKMLSVAVPARTRTIENDVYDYEQIARIADRILVMAYDEHWSSSAPGPIASFDWCERIARYSLETVGEEKLIMGLPFYGRTWGNVSLNRAFYFSGIQRIMRENKVEQVYRENGIPWFSYEISPVTVTGYYEDVYSLSERLNLYHDLGAVAVGFWCLGQEDPRIWQYLSIKKDL